MRKFEYHAYSIYTVLSRNRTNSVVIGPVDIANRIAYTARPRHPYIESTGSLIIMQMQHLDHRSGQFTTVVPCTCLKRRSITELEK